LSELKRDLEPNTITGRYNTVNDSIILNGAIPKLVWQYNNKWSSKYSATKDNALDLQSSSG
jgi:hypothetical protein